MKAERRRRTARPPARDFLLFGMLCAATLVAVVLGCSAPQMQPARAPAGWADQAAERQKGEVAPMHATESRVPAASMPTPPTGHHAAAVPAHWTPGSLPALHEEVWVIERGPVDEGPAEDRPRTGSMIGLLPDEKEVPLPLQHTDVKARVTGYIVTVDVTQQFHNPFDGKIEAVYLFPLPQTAAVSDFIMVIGERRIRGIVREREEARKIYAEAKRQGYVATLLTQERANVFTQRVANIEPKKRIDVRITYFQTLAYDEGWYEFTFPMV
ncbi:MAG TPA: VIT domain-containing protein, partial [Planctomycetota bacterium]|nr:VIT domain-containing protein [Planctomycetota bacterium]